MSEGSFICVNGFGVVCGRRERSENKESRKEAIIYYTNQRLCDPDPIDPQRTSSTPPQSLTVSSILHFQTPM